MSQRTGGGRVKEEGKKRIGGKRERDRREVLGTGKGVHGGGTLHFHNKAYQIWVNVQKKGTL